MRGICVAHCERYVILTLWGTYVSHLHVHMIVAFLTIITEYF